MIYQTKDEMRVAQEGFVIIEGVEHFVKGGFVACNRLLNHKAWNTTPKHKKCNHCAQMNQGGQLKLF